MNNLERFVSLLYMAEGDDEQHVKITTNAICNPKALKPRDYYLAAQMPILEMFGKTPEDIIVELGAYTIASDWKATGKRSIRVGDIVCVGALPYITLAEVDVLPEFKDKFKALPGTTVKNTSGNTEYRIGIMALETLNTNTDTLKDILCQVQKKT